MFKKILLPVAIALSLSPVAGAVSLDKAGKATGPSIQLIGGSTTSDWPSTVQFFVSGGSACTAVKIASHRYLTAAHCLIDKTTGEVESSAFFGARIYLSNVQQPTTSSGWTFNTLGQVMLHSSYVSEVLSRINSNESTNGAGMHSFDVATFTLQNTTPYPVSEVDFTEVSPGDNITLVGYGCEEKVGESRSGYGRKKAGDTYALAIDAYDNHPGYGAYYAGKAAEVFYHNVVVAAPKLDSSAPGLCPGDSGGPAFKNNKVVGVGAYYSFMDSSGIAYTNMETKLSALAGWAGWTL
ncbi:trypsin-like serine protease [Thalassomonas sp. RHCl1]|uniref:trypsin-like serine protease n=1 Tax=Thalassomonas sp. RHCl1 TaxID=2995320 RepID=UPI00248B4210|nr:trypsin-like serine protease [Thalassomonas sp. RHCl1]